MELPFSTRLLFAGLWTIADREGRLEDRPKKIKMAIFPADDVDVERGLSALHGASMVLRYVVNNKRFIFIPGFVKHQNPHTNEQASVIPAPELHGASMVQIVPLTSSLIPSSLNPDSLLYTEVENFPEPTWQYPMKELIEAFPNLNVTPTMIGFIEGDVKPGDEMAWAKTIEIYQMNFNPMTKTYLPEKTANLLGVFRKQKIDVEKQGNGKTHNRPLSEREKSAERDRNSRKFFDDLEREARAEIARENLLLTGGPDDPQNDQPG